MLSSPHVCCGAQTRRGRCRNKGCEEPTRFFLQKSPKGNPPTTPDTQNCRVDTKNTGLTGTGDPKFDGAREIRRSAPRNGNASPVVGGVGVVVVVITGVVDATNVVANVVVVLVVPQSMRESLRTACVAHAPPRAARSRPHGCAESSIGDRAEPPAQARAFFAHDVRSDS